MKRKGEENGVDRKGKGKEVVQKIKVNERKDVEMKRKGKKTCRNES